MTDQQWKEQFDSGYRAGLLAAVEECEKMAFATSDIAVQTVLSQLAVRIAQRGRDRKP